MFCTNCGSKIPDGGMFCVKCGKPATPKSGVENNKIQKSEINETQNVVNLKEPIILYNAEPIYKDAGKLQKPYMIIGGIGFVLGLIWGKDGSMIGSAILFGLFGLLIAWVYVSGLKCRFRMVDMQDMKFKCLNKPSYIELFEQVKSNLISNGLNIQVVENAGIIVTNGDMKYEVIYKDENTFLIHWSQSGLGILMDLLTLRGKMYGGLYKKANRDYRIIAYNIQRITGV